ncbi:SprT family zinc-dependent metalloprotease [Alteromonas pelagimontana]|uniref:SprT family zinc-dependent metalloprotease n=1 Tax=Alteromonas pelagimontana TaxID=1858656 RepID=A0A6M4MHG0_9ALTE|nr:SprT family zinc-dependent metalloprotease [Alteromonas pelagimontana]QJR82427.1 SprT family zinc-dependent metalloprotease [Alteromonas pelagimontana]
MNSFSLRDKQDVIQAVERLYHIAFTRLNTRFPLPEVTFRKSGKNAGTAFLQQNRINLHPLLFAHNKAAFFTDVIPHEVSHLITFQRFGRVKPHGKEWQYIMQFVFEVEPNTTHQFDLTPLKLKTYPYRCQCSTVELSVRRHNKVLKGQQYRCLRCNVLLESL